MHGREEESIWGYGRKVGRKEITRETKDIGGRIVLKWILGN
jgi:hypothetical protein